MFAERRKNKYFVPAGLLLLGCRSSALNIPGILSYFPRLSFTDTRNLIIPESPPPPSPEETESLDVWGFRDTRFDISAKGHVMIRGTRYELSGKELPRFLPWVREVLEIDVNPRDVHPPSYPTAIPESRIAPEFLRDIREFLTADQIDTTPES